MRPHLIICLLALCFTSALTVSRAQTTVKEFSALHVLSGSWKMETSKGFLLETWQKLDDSTLQSHGYRVTGKDTVPTEQVELVRRKGQICYMPVVHHQNNGKRVVFTLKKIENGAYTFENLEHDYPQRVVYALPQKDALHAWVEGELDGKNKRIDYNFIKFN